MIAESILLHREIFEKNNHKLGDCMWFYAFVSGLSWIQYYNNITRMSKSNDEEQEGLKNIFSLTINRRQV